MLGQYPSTRGQCMLRMHPNAAIKIVKYKHSHLRILVINTTKYSRTPIIRKLVIRTANYPERLGPSGKFVENYTKLALKLPVIGSSTVQGFGFQNFKSGVVDRFRRRYILQIVTAELQTANVEYFHIKIQLSVFSAYADGWPSQLIRISGVLLHIVMLYNFVTIFFASSARSHHQTYRVPQHFNQSIFTPFLMCQCFSFGLWHILMVIVS